MAGKKYDDDEDHSSSKHKRRRVSAFIDDVAEEEDDDEEEEDDEDEEYDHEDYRKKKKKRSAAAYIDNEAVVDTDDEEDSDDEIDADDGFIIDDQRDEEDARRMHHRPPPLLHDDDQEDYDDLERRIIDRFAKYDYHDDDEDDDDDDVANEVKQQALLPSIGDPKLWMVKCAIGHEREVAACLMQKCIDTGSKMQIRSAIALDHLKNYIYIEADKQVHVKEACKGMRSIYTGGKILLVPIKEMTDVLSVESKTVDLSRDTWVRMKTGTYKGDLAKVVDADNMRRKVTVKLIPRIDLQALVNKLEGREGPKMKNLIPPPRFINFDEVRGMHIPVERKRDHRTGEYFENINGMKFKDGLLYKIVSLRSISTQNIQPSFDELEKFRQPNENGDGDTSWSKVLANRKKGHFMKGDRVIVIKGELKNLKGWVEKVDEGTVHIKSNEDGLPKTISVSERELGKYFEIGNHVKVVCGAQEGVTGMVLTVEGHLVNIVSDTTKEVLRVFSDNVVESSEVTSGITKVGDFELRDLVQLDNMNFGVIIRIDSEAFQVLKGAADRADVQIVRLRDIKYKIDRKMSAHDHYKNMVSVKDVVKVMEGPCKGQQGTVEHIYKGMLFIYDRHHLEHAGFICAKAQACVLVGGSRANGDRNGNPFASKTAQIRTPTQFPNSLGRGGPPLRNVLHQSGGRHRDGGRGKDSLVGTTIKIRLGSYKGYKGRVVDVSGTSVRVELESQMKVVRVERNQISDVASVTTPYRETHRYGSGSETPIYPSRTPLHPYMTPMRDPGATPIHDGMRTPMRDRAWNPYTPISPPRDSWEDGNPGSWRTSPQYQPRSPRSIAYEAPTPGGSYSEAGTPRDTTPAYANAPSPYLPSTPGGQPMTPGGGDLDMMSPAVGGDNDGHGFLPDILVNVRRSSEDACIGVIREVLLDGVCRVALGSTGNGDVITANPNEIEVVVPRKSDKVKIMGDAQRGATGKLIGVDGTDGIVKLDDTLDVKILNMAILAKLAHLS